eukprot:657843-Pleurochrysis_carterae.AAC.3
MMILPKLRLLHGNTSSATVHADRDLPKYAQELSRLREMARKLQCTDGPVEHLPTRVSWRGAQQCFKRKIPFLGNNATHLSDNGKGETTTPLLCWLRERASKVGAQTRASASTLCATRLQPAPRAAACAGANQRATHACGVLQRSSNRLPKSSSQGHTMNW